ncbi:unnamed protein product [Echinostoma caproni]|uniref:Uncharacterized protein n=1 Tax=Echinostoma caproni TaxID=27848 RepID=A0A183BGI0_9TREM|nr:unnamed protein product [Echinostoma caproni]
MSDIDKRKKLMPHITTYNSDDSMDADEFSSSQEQGTTEPGAGNEDDDDDDDRPLVSYHISIKFYVLCFTRTKIELSPRFPLVFHQLILIEFQFEQPLGTH